MNDNNTVINDLKKTVKNFVEEREWRQFHNPKNLSMSVAIESAELMELFQWLSRKDAEKAIRPAVNSLIKNKCSKIILGCTELPIAIFAFKSFQKIKKSKTFLDPNLILAHSSMKRYKGSG